MMVMMMKMMMMMMMMMVMIVIITMIAIVMTMVMIYRLRMEGKVQGYRGGSVSCWRCLLRRASTGAWWMIEEERFGEYIMHYMWRGVSARRGLWREQDVHEYGITTVIF